MLLNFRDVRILVIGDVMLDRYVWGDVRRISPEAPVPVLHVRRKTHVLGGAGNVANNLVGLGARVDLFGVRSDDSEGEQLAKLLDTHGIGDHLFVVADRPTITKQRIMAHNQQLMRLDEETVIPMARNDEDEFMSGVMTRMEAADGVILSDYGKGLLTESICRKVVEGARKQGIPVLVDPKGTDWQRYLGSSCITPNAKEFAAFTGTSGAADRDSLLSMARKVLEDLQLDHLLVTLGADGMLLAGRGEEPAFIPAIAREVYDVSGAGDTVIATLAASLTSGKSWREAAELANTAAGIVVGKVGTQPVFLEELDRAVGRRDGHNPKICSWEEAARRLAQWHDMGQKVVFANGCFDLLHAGHVNLLHAAAREGNRLVVALNSDSSVRRLKGPTRPILDQNDRASIVAALECVDLVVLFDQDTPLELIRQLKPDVLAKGADYTRERVVGHELVESWGGRVALIPLTEGRSTTGVVTRITEGLKTGD